MEHYAYPAGIAVAIGLALYVLLLCLASLVPEGTPGVSAATALFGRNLKAHAEAYGILTFILCCLRLRANMVMNALVAVTSSAAVAATLEAAQTLVPSRTASLRDFAAGIMGTLVGGGAWLGYRALRPAAKRLASKGD